MRRADSFKKIKAVESIRETKTKFEKIGNTEKADTARLDNKNFYRKAKKK